MIRDGEKKMNCQGRKKEGESGESRNKSAHPQRKESPHHI